MANQAIERYFWRNGGSYVSRSEGASRFYEEQVKRSRADVVGGIDDAIQRRAPRIGILGMGVAGARFGAKIGSRGGLALVFGDKIGGQALGEISDFIHYSRRRDGGGRTVLRDLTAPGVVPVPMHVDMTPTGLQELVDRFHLKRLVLAHGGNERRNNALVYDTASGIWTSRDLIGHIHHKLDWHEDMYPAGISSRGEYPRRAIGVGGGRILQDWYALTRALQAAPAVARRAGVDVSDIDPRRLVAVLDEQGEITDKTENPMVLRRNLAEFGLRIGDLGSVTNIHRGLIAEFRWLKPSGPVISDVRQQMKTNPGVRDLIQTLQDQNHMSEDEAITEYARRAHPGFRHQNEAYVRSWADAYGVKLLPFRVVTAAERTAPATLTITVKPATDEINKTQTLRGDHLMTSMGTVPATAPAGLSVPVDIIGLANGSGDMAASTTSARHLADRLTSGMQDPNGIGYRHHYRAVREQVRNVWGEAGFDGDIVGWFFDHNGERLLDPWLRAEEESVTV